MITQRTQTLSILASIAIGVAVTALTGCNLQDTGGPSETAMSAVSGRVIGGESPIVGASVTLWETDPNNTGYPSASNEKAVKLAGPVSTNAVGAFIFTTGYTCQSNQFVYATATGGNTGAGTNNNAVLIAALGSCSNFTNATAQAKVELVVNEVSTVVAAYTLGNFMYVDDSTVSAGTTQVYIGAPVNNNASSGSCTGNGSAMTCTAAGLAHAFANAANLSNSVSYTSFPTGQAYTTVPGNSLGSVPQAEINTLANILQYCVNSTGGSAPGGVTDGTNCGNLFAYSSVSGTPPQDTLSAMVNISKNPKSNVGAGETAGVSNCSGATGGLWCLAPGTGSSFNPQLSQPPADWSLAITYTGIQVGGSSGPTSSWGSTSATYYPVSVALDAADNLYILSGNATTSATSVTATMSAMTSNGTGLWANASTIDAANGCYPGLVATDTNGNVWNSYAPPSAKTCTASIYERSASTGGTATLTMTSAAPYSIQGQASAIVFDRYNNLWYSRDTSSGSNYTFRFPYSGNGGTYLNNSTSAFDVELAGTTSSGTLASVLSMLIDQYGNVYLASTAGKAYIEPNQTPSSTPTYTGQATGGANAAVTTAYLTQALQATSKTGSIALDNTGNLWAGGVSGQFTKVVPATTSGVITGTSASNVTAQTSGASSAGTPYFGVIDSANVYWYPSNTTSGQLWFSKLSTSATAPTTDDIYTCYAPNGATTCSNLTYGATGPGAPSTSTASPTQMVIDSTGTIWVTAENIGNMVQIFGAAAPVWPQASFGVFGTAPH